MFVYGSEFPKGVGNNQKSIEPTPSTFSNSPIIMKDYFEVSGSDTAQIGWIEIAAEDGSAGYFWYMKAEAETRLRFEDYMEMAMVEGELATGTDILAAAGDTLFNATNAPVKGTQGLFSAIME